MSIWELAFTLGGLVLLGGYLWVKYESKHKTGVAIEKEEQEPQEKPRLRTCNVHHIPCPYKLSRDAPIPCCVPSQKDCDDWVVKYHREVTLPNIPDEPEPEPACEGRSRRVLEL